MATERLNVSLSGSSIRKGHYLADIVVLTPSHKCGEVNTAWSGYVFDNNVFDNNLITTYSGEANPPES